MLSEKQPLLHKEDAPGSSFLWRLFHFVNFMTGGTTFIAGTTCLFFQSWAASADRAALLYTIGSVGFLGVDVMEIFTFTGMLSLTINIGCSVIGSTLYILGSVGFFPELHVPWMGNWGFVLGSFFIGMSEIWKLHRMGSESGKFDLSSLYADIHAITATGVEFCAGLGGWSFFFGTLLYMHDFSYFGVLVIWLMGACWFTGGSVFLGYRHFVLGV